MIVARERVYVSALAAKISSTAFLYAQKDVPLPIRWTSNVEHTRNPSGDHGDLERQ